MFLMFIMNSTSQIKRQMLGVFSIAMITAVSVDSIRNLPATALFGSTLLFFFLIAAVFFLLPCALVSAELTSTSNQHGGVYVWVKNAFGKRAGFLAIWFQWVENVIWYPTILSFVAGTVGYLIAPSLINNKLFLVTIILCSFWGATFVNLLGIKSSARFSNFCALTGLLLPMGLIIILGLLWIFSGRPMQIHFTHASLLPHLNDPQIWVAMTGIIMSFCGMEIATVHGFDVKNPQSTYPKAMIIATLIILLTLLSGALSIAVVLPEKEISLVAGIMQAFNAFFSVYHMQWILPVIAAMLIVGGMGGVSNWIIAPIRGLLIAARDGNMPKHFHGENRFQAPKTLLLYQSVIVTLVTMVFLFMPSVNGSYWLLTALASQLYMMMYILMFASAIRLRYKNHNQVSGFRIPFGNWGIWIVCVAGILGSVGAFIIGFIPPSNINVGTVFHYELSLLIGLAVMSVPPFIMYWVYNRKSIVVRSEEAQLQQG